MIRTLLLASIFLCLAHSVLFSQTDEPKPPAAQNTAEQQAPAANTSPQPAAAPVAPAQTQTTAKTPKGVRTRGRNPGAAEDWPEHIIC